MLAIAERTLLSRVDLPRANLSAAALSRAALSSANALSRTCHFLAATWRAFSVFSSSSSRASSMTFETFEPIVEPPCSEEVSPFSQEENPPLLLLLRN